MAFALPLWIAVQEELLQDADPDPDSACCFDDFDDDALFRTFHLTRASIAFITDNIRIRMKKVAQKKLRVDAMVMVALSYYAHGVTSAAVQQKLGLTQNDCLSVVCTVSGVIAGMADQFISFPLTQAARANAASRTRRLCGVPDALGVLAAAHFRIRASPYEKDTFRSFVNSLGYTSVVSQIICDADGNILSVEKCCVGSTCEQDLWEASFKGREMEHDIHGHYWVIGGSGYLLSKHVLTPVQEPANEKERRFNRAHARIQDVMRTTLGSMKRRFRCLMQLGFAQEGSLDKKSNIIKACSVLHNISKKFSVPPPPAVGKIERLHPGRQHAAPAEVNAEALKSRQQIIDVKFSVESGAEEPPDDGATEEDPAAV